MNVNTGDERIKTVLRDALVALPQDERVVILYHSKCPDGIVAMDVLRSRYVNSLCLPLNPNCLPRDEEIDNKYVICVDLYQSNENIHHIGRLAKYLLYIDHHPRDACIEESNIKYVYTQEHSASGIVTIDSPQPYIANLIEPNDMGRFDEVSKTDNLLYQGWYDRYWKQGDLTNSVAALRWCVEGNADLLRTSLINEGNKLREAKNKKFTALMDKVIVRKIHGREVALCYSDSDKGELANFIRERVDQDIVCVWGWGKRGQFYTSSWRSTETNLDIMLKPLGGGGHPQASGLQIPIDKTQSFLGEPRWTFKGVASRLVVPAVLLLTFTAGVVFGKKVCTKSQ